MKICTLVWLALLTPALWGQGVRYDNNTFTAANNVPIGEQAPMFTLPFSTVTVCSTPSIGEPCVNPVAIYSDAAMTQPVTNPMQTDALGRFGFFLPAGLYEYSVVTAQGTYVGTYFFQVGGGTTTVTGGNCLTAAGNYDVLYKSGTNCAGDQYFIYNGALVDINGGRGFEVDATNRSAQNYFNITWPEILWYSDGSGTNGTGGSGGISFFRMNFSDQYADPATDVGITPIVEQVKLYNPNTQAIGLQFTPEVHATGTTVTGIELDNVSYGGTPPLVTTGIVNSIGQGTTSAIGFENAFYRSAVSCDILNHDPSVSVPNIRESIGCGMLATNTFQGPVKTTNTDNAGEITLASGTGTYTFLSTLASRPECFVHDHTNPAATPTFVVTNTTLTITGTGSDVIGYGCMLR